jgi:hypothetical protein
MIIDVVSVLAEAGHTSYTTGEVDRLGSALANQLGQFYYFDASYADGFVRLEPIAANVEGYIGELVSAGLVQQVLGGG